MWHQTGSKMYLKRLGCWKSRFCIKKQQKCTLNAGGVKNTFCGFQNLYPHAGREAHFVFDDEKMSRPEWSWVGFKSKLAFSLQRSRQNSKKEAWNARGVENVFCGEIPQAGSKKKVRRTRTTAPKTHLTTPLLREADFCWAGNRNDTLCSKPEIGFLP